MQAILVTILCIGCVLAGTVREKRQTTNCQEPDVANVCLQTAGRVYFPHPTDNNKFLQCSDGGRMFIIKCPKGEIYNKATTACSKVQVTNPAVTNPTNPCTAQNIASGNVFFPYANDKTKFIECNSQGQPTVLSCPTRLVYDASRQSCVLPAGTIVNAGTTKAPTNGGGGTATNTGVVIGTGTMTNPCTPQAVQSNNLFFPHPDPTKFIHCDLVGNAYVMQCPAALVWSQLTSNCQSPYTAATLNGGTSGGSQIGK
ncbi:probable endochitinase [Mercenaria mercenaria]|uniref:probable endochitinase n=1 Tax=Mercenaria mercenaria TaxID=6596 RepID=UPI001E1DF72E|nr:probable endochitinase [Mercenaria mercenaria]